MYNASNLLKPFLGFDRKIIVQLTLMLCLLRGYPVQGQSQATIGQVHEATGQSKGLSKWNKQDEWITFPYSIQISPYLGFTQKIPQLLKREDTQKTNQFLRIIGASVDLGVVQIRRFIWKHFHCYPKLGLVFSYGWLENGGGLTSGQLYLEPQHNYLGRWEIVPRLGIGVVYVNIPGTNFEEPAPEDEEGGQSDDDFAADFYRQGLHLDLSLALAMNIRLTPHWQLSPSIGFSYRPALERAKSDEAEKHSQEDTDLKIVKAGIGLSYTPNPSLIHYPSLGSSKRSRVDIGFLSSFKKSEPIPQNQQEDTASEGEYCYVGGLYGQWGLQLCNSHALTLATEWIQDGAAEQALKGKIRSSPLKISLLGGHEFRWGKLLFGQQLGCYLMNNIPQEFILYARLGLDYRLTASLFLGLNMKIGVDMEKMWAIETDFIDFRVGYSF